MLFLVLLLLLVVFCLIMKHALKCKALNAINRVGISCHPHLTPVEEETYKYLKCGTQHHGKEFTFYNNYSEIHLRMR